MNVAPGERRKRMVENIHVLRHRTNDTAPFVGQFTNFSNVTLEPKPVQSPCPIWLATNAERRRKVRPILAGRTSRSRASARSRTAG